MISFLLLAAATVLPAPDRWVPDDAEQAEIRALHASSKVPGMQIAVLEDGKVAWHANYGVMNSETMQPVTDETLFQVASLSKPVFAYLVVKMLEEGQIGIDDKLVDYVVPFDMVEHEWNREITVRHVLTHRTGLPNWRPAEPDAAQHMVPKCKPGTCESYSGEAFLWLQEVIETIAGRSTTQLLEDHVFEPAGIEASLGWRPAIGNRLATGHYIDRTTGEPDPRNEFGVGWGPRMQAVAERWGRPIDEWRMGDWFNALRVVHPALPVYEPYGFTQMSQPTDIDAGVAGSLRSNAVNYAKFMGLLMDDMPHADWKISEPGRRWMLSPHTRRERAELPGGFGLGVELKGQERYFYHSGNNGNAFHAFMFGHPASGNGIVVLTNGEGGDQLYWDVFDVLIDEEFLSNSKPLD